MLIVAVKNIILHMGTKAVSLQPEHHRYLVVLNFVVYPLPLLVTVVPEDLLPRLVAAGLQRLVSVASEGLPLFAGFGHSPQSLASEELSMMVFDPLRPLRLDFLSFGLAVSGHLAEPMMS